MKRFFAAHRLSSACKAGVCKSDFFQNGKKAFHSGVVKTTSGAPHALPELVISQGISVFSAGILAAPV
jgi:hypothetical protein